MIRAQNVSKYYGAKRALGPVSFEIEDGETVGFLGLNGAGKTTALRIFACDLRPSAGGVVVGDIDAVANPHEVRKRIGYLPEAPPLYPDMVVEQYLAYAGRLRGMSSAEVKKRLPAVLEATDITDVRNEVIRTLSHGYRQRVGVSQAIIHDPKLLILDEPTRGLDPVQIVEMRSMIHELKERHTVLISSHILTEISETCDRLLVLGKGEILAKGTETDLRDKIASLSDKAKATERMFIALRPKEGSDESNVRGTIEAVEGVAEASSESSEESGTLLFKVSSEEDLRGEVCRAVVEAGHSVVKLAKGERELENIFLQLVQGGGQNHASN